MGARAFAGACMNMPFSIFGNPLTYSVCSSARMTLNRLFITKEWGKNAERRLWCEWTPFFHQLILTSSSCTRAATELDFSAQIIEFNLFIVGLWFHSEKKHPFSQTFRPSIDVRHWANTIAKSTYTWLCAVRAARLIVMHASEMWYLPWW